MTGFEPRPLVLESTAQPTEPHRCPRIKYFYSNFSLINRVTLVKSSNQTAPKPLVI